MKITIRQSQKEDMPKVLEYIQELATYEKAPDEMENTVEDLEKNGFGDHKVFDCIVAEIENNIVGFALYYTGYSTWKGRTLYLEDFLVSEDYRGKGIGKLLFNQVILEAKKRNVKRMDWQVIDWNKPAINFYNKYNARLDGEWINGRLFEEDIRNFTIN
ncbi:GNAT family N-acetyltransferase [Flavobacteriales bacterium]|nr:GNAT family N-acetyltransferase [Flavobacteriales bacterium]